MIMKDLIDYITKISFCSTISHTYILYVIGDTDDATVEIEAEVPKCSSLILSRFLFTCGNVALQELIHLDVAVFGELKRRRAVCEANKQSKAGARKLPKSARSSNASVAASATKIHRVCSAL